MPVYTFKFPEHTFGGTVCTITNEAGTVVHTETLGSTPDADGAVTLEVSLPEGVYAATAVTTGTRTLTTQGTLDVVDSISVGGGGSWLSGHGAPGSGPQLDPLDGVSDPWRWSDDLGGWVSPAFEVTWVEGDVLPATALTGVEVAVATGVSPVGPYLYYANSGTPSDAATEDSAGVGFVVQYEVDFTHTTVPDAELDPTTLFGDFVAGDAYEFPEVSTGSDGQWYVDLDTRDVYGPRTDGDWTHFSTLPAPS